MTGERGPLRSLIRIGDEPDAVRIAVTDLALHEHLQGWSAEVEIPELHPDLAPDRGLTIELGRGRQRDRAWPGVLVRLTEDALGGGRAEIVDPLSWLRRQRIRIALGEVRVEEAIRRILGRARDAAAESDLPGIEVTTGAEVAPETTDLVVGIDRPAGALIDEIVEGRGVEAFVSTDPDDSLVLRVERPGTRYGTLAENLLDPEPLRMETRMMRRSATEGLEARVRVRSALAYPGQRARLGPAGDWRLEHVLHRLRPFGYEVHGTILDRPRETPAHSHRPALVEGTVEESDALPATLLAPDEEGRIPVRLTEVDPPVRFPILTRGQGPRHAWLGGFASGDDILVLLDGCLRGWIAGSLASRESELGRMLRRGDQGMVLGTGARVRIGAPRVEE